MKRLSPSKTCHATERKNVTVKRFGWELTPELAPDTMLYYAVGSYLLARQRGLHGEQARDTNN